MRAEKSLTTTRKNPVQDQAKNFDEMRDKTSYSYFLFKPGIPKLRYIYTQDYSLTFNGVILRERISLSNLFIVRVID